MPPRNNSSQPPKVMTWKKAIFPVFILAGLVDLLRAFFTAFWFFGPALAAVYCSSKVSGWVGSLWGLTDKACSAVVAAGGSYVSPVTAPFGVLMADSVGFLGFLIVGFLVLRTNERITKTATSAPLQFAGAFALGEIPFLGALPLLTLTLWRLYGAQIRTEKAAFKKWEEENAAAIAAQRNKQIMQAAQIQAAQQGQLLQEEAANEAVYARAQAANDEQYEIPEDEKLAA